MQITNTTWTIQYIKENHFLGIINYQPDFQRRSVWSEKQKVYLIDTLLNDFSIPKVYVRQIYDEQRGGNIYEIIDGQQRLTTIMAFLNGEFKLSKKRHPKPEYFDYNLEDKYFHDLSIDQKKKIINYTISVDLVEGTKEEITEMFLRLNLSNTSLNSLEIINSQYFGDFKAAVSTLSEEFIEKFVENKILSASSIKRMGDMSLVSSCLVFQLYGITDKQKKIETAFKDYDSWDEDSMDTSKREFRKIFNLISETLFESELRTTKFNSLNGFLSLFEFFHDYLCKRNFSLQKEQFENVRETLYWFQLNIKQDGIGVGKEWFDCTQQGGDTLNSRHKRKEILESLLRDFFNKKDLRRSFSKDERKIAWNSSDRRCQNPKCNKLINSFEEFDLDHIIPFDRGGTNEFIKCTNSLY